MEHRNVDGKVILRSWTLDDATGSVDEVFNEARQGIPQVVDCGDGEIRMVFAPKRPIPTSDEMGEPFSDRELELVFGIDPEVLRRHRRERGR